MQNTCGTHSNLFLIFMEKENILDRLANFKKSFLLQAPKHVEKSKIRVPNHILNSIYIPDIAKAGFDVDIATTISFDNLNIITSSPKRKFVAYCQLFSRFFEQETGQKMLWTIYYFPSPNLGPKVLPNPSIPLGSRDINSGVTFHLHNSIVIYREEEANKVLIHELIHAYRLDEGINLKSVPYVPTSKVPIRFTETYTELLAALLYTELNRGKLARNTAFTNLFAHFNKQAEKVLCTYTTKFHQDTHVFEYIIAKNALVQALPFLDDLLPLFDNHALFSLNLKNAITDYMKNFKCYLSSLG